MEFTVKLDNEKVDTLPKKSRILVVEDNRINQVVLQGVLNNINLCADIATNGIEALSLLSMSVDRPYEIILMDCQMPKMDGFEATIAIRDGVAGESYREIPIIALTANAMEGDEDKCISVGMNDYITKPVDPNSLCSKLCHWLGIRANNQTLISDSNDTLQNTGESSTSESGDVTWQQAAFFQRVSNNSKLANKIIHLFLEDSPIIVDELIGAIDSLDTEKIKALSHKLKGSVRNIGGEKLANILETIEYFDRDNDQNNLANVKKRFVAEYQLLIDELQLYIR